MTTVATILQGPTKYLKNLGLYYDYLGTIVSTWENEEIDHGWCFEVIKNKIPSNPGIGNLNMQTVSTTAGLKLAKRYGFTHAFKIRSDIYFSDYDKLLRNLDYTKLNFLCYHTHDGGYLVDYICFGPIDEMLLYWDYYSEDYSRPADVQLSNKYLKNTDKKVSYILPILLKENIDAIWIKKGINLRDYAKDPLFTY